jgi:hypothetical protein
MTPRAKLELADAYDEVVRHLDAAAAAIEGADRVALDAAMRRATEAMDAAGELIVADPRPIRLHSPAQRATARQRRHRARVRRGERVAPVVFGEAVLDTLVALRWLREDEAEDRAKVGEAIAALLTDLAQHSTH